MGMMKTWKIRLHVITPVHIGCGDVYEPTSFYVDKTNNKLICFDPFDFIGALLPRERSRFLEICQKGTVESIFDMYSFIDSVVCRPLKQKREVMVSKGFIDNFKNVLGSRDITELNNFQISRTSFLPHDNLPYVPGSALKGSLRTGWLNWLHKGVRQQVEGKKSKDFEERLIGGSFESDPFRMLKIPDLIPVDNPETRICYAVNKKKKPSQSKREQRHILEVITPQSAVFEGMITIHDAKYHETGITNPVPVSLEFFKRATTFFDKEMTKEEEVLKGIKLPANVKNKTKSKFGEKYLQNVFPVRIGRHSSAECLTIDGVRNIRIMGKRGETTNKPNTTTIWLAGDSARSTSGLEPFGWCAIELLEIDTADLAIHCPKIELAPSPIVPPVETVAAPRIMPQTIVWNDAVLTWDPGSATLIAASSEGKKGTTKDRALVPEEVINRLKKGKIVKATVSLQQEGNSYSILSIDLSS